MAHVDININININIYIILSGVAIFMNDATFFPSAAIFLLVNDNFQLAVECPQALHIPNKINLICSFIHILSGFTGILYITVSSPGVSSKDRNYPGFQFNVVC
jgi:hypothetical protein